MGWGKYLIVSRLFWWRDWPVNMAGMLRGGCGSALLIVEENFVTLCRML